MHFLFCPDFLCEAGDCLNMCLCFLIQCINVHVYILKQVLRLTKKQLSFHIFPFQKF